jgi:hypothetical protein
MRKNGNSMKPSRLALLAEKALKSAVKKVVAEHKRIKLPLVVWKKGKVVKIPAHKI